MLNKIHEVLSGVYPVEINKVEAVTDEMFRCTTAEEEYFARITNYKSYDEQLEEVHYTNFLFNEGLGVSQAIPSINGRAVEKVILEGREIFTVLYKSAPGAHLSKEEWNTDVLKEVGRQIGKMHRLSKKYEEVHQIRSIKDWHENEEYAFLKYIPEEESVIRDIAEEVRSSIKKTPRDPSNYGLIHGDIWLENILVDEDMNLTMVDFQDCEKHFYIFDLAVPLYSALEYSFIGGGNIIEYGNRITGAMIEGYEEEHSLSPEMVEKLPLFMKLKEIFEYSLMHMYWDKDHLTEEQVRIMNHFRKRIEGNHSMLNT